MPEWHLAFNARLTNSAALLALPCTLESASRRPWLGQIPIY
uniref:Uncharacterized protein n=1 Tax=Klebsiella pneumoniae TaxID=573 RepID=A0A223LM05_KLEPN|nr:Hypothetical protein [Klebsiella pneumoniae]